ncbi:prevent-host-death family protein [Streptococcus rupicaprae]|uniref:Antitoxin n=1 Tax=Streptococcus rupicaprae TaxID=759619 RepID=A0ABV2FG04_9STRE
MLNIRPVSDLRNKFSEVEQAVIQTGEPVFLTKNGYGSMVVMSLEQYSLLTDKIERQLDEADEFATVTTERFSAEEVFGRVRSQINES